MIARMDLADTPVRDREELLDSLTSVSCAVPFRSRCADRSRPLTFAHVERGFDDVTVFENRYSNYSGHRPVGAARLGAEQVMTIGLPLGPMGFAQGERRVRATAGSAVAFWGRSAYAAEVRREITYTALVVPVESIGLPSLLLANLTGVDIGRSPLAEVFTAHVRGLLALPELSAQEERALADPTRQLLRAVLVTAAGDEFAAREPLQRTLELRATAFLEARFTDPDPRVEALAAHLGVSRTAAFALLRRMGVGFTEWVKERRLTRAAELLRDPTSALVGVGRIGAMVGFGDPTTFSRAFRARYGQTPNAWRSSAAPRR